MTGKDGTGAFHVPLIRRRRVSQLIVLPGCLVLVLSHLVEGKDLHPVHVVEGFHKAGHRIDVFITVGQSGNQHETDPHLAAQFIQPAGKLERWLKAHPGDLLVGGGPAALDVEQDEVGVLQQFITGPLAKKPGRIQRGVQSQLLCSPEQGVDELWAKFSDAEGNEMGAFFAYVTKL